MKAAELFVQCLANEDIDCIYGIPGEENVDLMDALLESGVEFILTRHEQAAAFMADVYGRLTGKAGVCLATLGPGACNLITGATDANMDSAPVVAIAGQADTTRMHKESHQHLDLVHRIVSWNGNNDVGSLAEKPVRLRFVMKDSDLYSIRFHPEQEAAEKSTR